jgi:hypothetical protein
VYEAIEAPRDSHCDACFSGDFPLEKTLSAKGKFGLERVPAAAHR